MQDPDGGASTTWETQGIQANGAAQRLTVDGGSAGIRMAARQFGGAFLPAVLKDGHIGSRPMPTPTRGGAVSSD